VSIEQEVIVADGFVIETIALRKEYAGVEASAGPHARGRFGVAVVDQLFRPSAFSFFRVLSAEPYFRSGALPWLALIAAIAVSSMLLFARRKTSRTTISDV
jgi:hypothetical protein